MTLAPRIASTRIVSNPIPDVHPVTSATLPLRSIPSVTSSAVDFALNPLRGTPSLSIARWPLHAGTAGIAHAAADSLRKFLRLIVIAPGASISHSKSFSASSRESSDDAADASSSLNNESSACRKDGTQLSPI
jgi:hypothetical protein